MFFWKKQIEASVWYSIGSTMHQYGGNPQPTTHVQISQQHEEVGQNDFENQLDVSFFQLFSHMVTGYFANISVVIILWFSPYVKRTANTE